MKKNSKVLMIAETCYRYIYPQIPDLAELLARRGYVVMTLIPEDEEVRDWNSGRGFEIAFTRRIKIRLPGLANPWYAFQVLPRLLEADIVIGFTTPTVLILLIANRLLKKKTIYYALELMVPFTRGSGAYASLQHLLRFTTISVLTTGSHRSRILQRAVGLAHLPAEIRCCALRTTKAISNHPESTIAERVRKMAGQPDGLVVLCNGGLTELNGFGLLLAAAIPAKSGVLIALSGPLSMVWHEKLAGVSAATGNYFYVGEVHGTHYELIEHLRGADLGIVLKKMDHTQALNDRLYTPNKLFDFIAAGVPVLCSKQSTLTFVKKRGLGFVLEDFSVEGLRAFLLGLPDRRTEIANLAKSVRDAFDEDLNMEQAARPLLDILA